MKRFFICTVAVLAVLSFGLVLIHCGGSDDDKQCETNEDCPTGYWCDRTVWECKLIDCIPSCTGKCCGDDLCGGTCPNNCPTGSECNMTSCICEATGCQTDADCTATQCCKTAVCTDMSCGTLQCGPDPVCGKECGPCQTGYHCDMGTCVENVTCTTDAQCAATECCINSECQAMACGALECGPDPVCGKECGPCVAPEVCNNGVCEGGGPGDLCPVGQDCIQMGAAGAMGCVIPPNTVPPENATDCANTPCVGNYSCYCMDDTCSTSVCIENCGTCTAGLDCCELWDGGPLGCLTAGCVDLPANPPYCDQNTPCQGNAGCYTDGTDNFCIGNCSTDRGPCTNGETQCDGDTVQTCTAGAWVNTTDCTTTSQVCANGACVAPAGLGDFCDTAPCGAGLDCISTGTSVHAFCTPQCDCTAGTGCDAGWECLFGNGDPPTTCWCAKLCTTAADCPDAGGGGFSCEVLANDGTDDIYGCMIQ